MNNLFIQAVHGDFTLGGNPLLLKGFGIGSWMNFEHFMLRIPGSEKRIREVFAEVYGAAKADRFFEELLTNFIAEDDFRFLKSLGINCLRLALSYRYFEDDQNPGVYLESGFRHVDRVLQLCKEYGIFAVLDMHASPGGQNPDMHSGAVSGTALFWTDVSLRDRLIGLWRHIAERYNDETVIAGYDILNEPAFIPDKDVFNSFYKRVIQTIRDVDGNHIVFLEGDYWARDFSLFDQLGGEQLALSFHFYPGQHVSIYDDPDQRKQEMNIRLQAYIKLRRDTGMPLWCGETGGLFPANRLKQGNELIAQCLELFKQYRISWSIWSYKDAQAMSLVYPKSDTPWMRFVNELRPHWQSKTKRTGNVTAEVFNMIKAIFSYDIDDLEREKLSFRVSSLLYDLHMDYLVKPKLQAVPWDKIKVLPQSFLWKNCEYRRETAKLFTQYASNDV